MRLERMFAKEEVSLYIRNMHLVHPITYKGNVFKTFLSLPLNYLCEICVFSRVD